MLKLRDQQCLAAPTATGVQVCHQTVFNWMGKHVGLIERCATR